jgi:hypothetical protein
MWDLAIYKLKKFAVRQSKNSRQRHLFAVRFSTTHGKGDKKNRFPPQCQRGVTGVGKNFFAVRY